VGDKQILSLNLTVPLKKVFPSTGKVIGKEEMYYTFNHTNTGIRVVNRLQKEESNVYLSTEEFSANSIDFEPGNFILKANEIDLEKVQSLAMEFNFVAKKFPS
jgi:hypothetical protein